MFGHSDWEWKLCVFCPLPKRRHERMACLLSGEAVHRLHCAAVCGLCAVQTLMAAGVSQLDYSSWGIWMNCKTSEAEKAWCSPTKTCFLHINTGQPFYLPWLRLENLKNIYHQTASFRVFELNRTSNGWVDTCQMLNALRNSIPDLVAVLKHIYCCDLVIKCFEHRNGSLTRRSKHLVKYYWAERAKLITKYWCRNHKSSHSTWEKAIGVWKNNQKGWTKSINMTAGMDEVNAAEKLGWNLLHIVVLLRWKCDCSFIVRWKRQGGRITLWGGSVFARRQTDMKTFQKQTDCLWPWWIPHCDCGVTKHASQSLSDGEFPNMPLTEQRRPGSVKAHGKARPARRRGTMWLRKEGSVSVPSSRLSLDRAAGRSGWDDGKRPGVWSHGPRSQHRHCSTLRAFLSTRPPSSSDAALSACSVSLSVSVSSFSVSSSSLPRTN